LFNLDLFLRLIPQIDEKRSSVHPGFVNPGVLVIKTLVPVDDAHVKHCFLRIGNDNKPIPDSYDIGRLRFLSRLFAQLLIQEPIYFEAATLS
jgi:hypothetical protein